MIAPVSSSKADREVLLAQSLQCCHNGCQPAQLERGDRTVVGPEPLALEVYQHAETRCDKDLSFRLPHEAVKYVGHWGITRSPATALELSHILCSGPLHSLHSRSGKLAGKLLSKSRSWQVVLASRGLPFDMSEVGNNGYGLPGNLHQLKRYPSL